MFMVASMAGFAVEDMLLKTAAQHMPVGQAMMMIGLCGMAVFALMSRRMGEPILPRLIASRAMAIRSVLEVAGRLFHALAIALTTLSATSAILQASPLLVLAGAAVLFGEKVPLSRWIAVAVGFLGVLLILQPGSAGFSALSLLAVAGTIGFAGRDLATRAAPKGLSNRQLGTLGFAMLAVAGGLILSVTGGAQMPDAAGFALVAATAVFAVLGYHALTAAMRTGEVSAVTPFRYTRLVFALILGAVIFGERPDLPMLLGAVLVVGAGLSGLRVGARRIAR
ncbi:DMT family transporter [Xinfangfangia sp. CPCC 101601]|uniref:DMT family transporter n=1 Tax=Pseudogemmobacter lacusdianii TaxID=3069608 RepID=A0ABU0VYR3_9RHOB|nr:DMT family transporter [Xinfangfangia sp. CPCC 101601]MDQ2066854.1 DMT family transporter [Xinfangfangia sp. CPCC 101601]